MMLNCTSPCINPLYQHHEITIDRRYMFHLIVPCCMDDYFIIQKYDQFDHGDRPEINTNSSVYIPDNHILIDCDSNPDSIVRIDLLEYFLVSIKQYLESRIFRI